VDVAAWEAALIADMRAEAAVLTRSDTGAPLASIFFGGGTPSLMPPALVSALITEAERLWGFASDIEITLEANPSSVEAANFAALAAAGINRVSLGVQSLDDTELRFLGRLHGAKEALEALETAQAAFKRVSFDLIYALPGHTPELWHDRLTRALSFGTGHLSLYQLTIEPGTRFASDMRRGLLTPLDNDAAADLFDITQELTSAAGLPAYETSNHARAGEQSRHNLAYWRYQDYCGIGPGAHGRRGGMATVRHKKPENFLNAVVAQGDGIGEARVLAVREQAVEALLMGLRLTEGLDLAALSVRFALPRGGLVDEAALDRLIGLGLMWHHGTRIGVALPGRGLLDALLADVVADSLVAA
jgi:oxygen-independent coproporphyrinogen-3 oxidase